MITELRDTGEYILNIPISINRYVGSNQCVAHIPIPLKSMEYIRIYTTHVFNSRSLRVYGLSYNKKKYGLFHGNSSKFNFVDIRDVSLTSSSLILEYKINMRIYSKDKNLITKMKLMT